MSDWFNKRLTTEVNPRDCYKSDSHLVVRQRYDGVRPSTTEVAIRRVIPWGGSEELQIEIVIQDHRKNRTLQHFGALIVTPEIAEQIAKVCLELRGKAVEAA